MASETLMVVINQTSFDSWQRPTYDVGDPTWQLSPATVVINERLRHSLMKFLEYHTAVGIDVIEKKN